MPYRLEVRVLSKVQCKQNDCTRSRDSSELSSVQIKWMHGKYKVCLAYHANQRINGLRLKSTFIKNEQAAALIYEK